MKYLCLTFWWPFLLLPLFSGFVPKTIAQPMVTSRAGASTVRLPDRIPVVGYALQDAFPGVRFNEPVALAAAPAETNRLFVAERGGAIYVITNLAQPNKTLFLDLSQSINASYAEGGLLGVTFHPGYTSNGFFFVFVTKLAADYRFHEAVLRFAVSPSNPNIALADSELLILAQTDDSDQHNGGDLKFGPDGYLYISIGERVYRDISWPDQTPVDRDLQGAILRIDVDSRPDNLPPNFHPGRTEHYRVPADNPFVGITQYHGQAVSPAAVRTELYAVGFRNPWRMTFDSITGELYVADVGDSSSEEVSRVLPGGHYGWPYREGLLTRAYPPPPHFNPQPPWHTYEHGWSGGTNGDCVIGGVVYRGGAMPWLSGQYLFADHRSGYLWAAQDQDGKVTVERLLDATIGLTTFGTDPRDGEVLAAHLFDGTILRLVHQPPALTTNIPLTLEATGIFADLARLTPSEGVEPYEINVPFWSDHAIKTRWFSLPEDAGTIGYNAAGTWTFPTGAFWVKHFELELTNGVPASARRLETRVLVSTSEGFYGLTYRWGDSTTNAWLVPAEGQVERFTIRDAQGSILREQDWLYPSRADCIDCHTKWSGGVLGFNTAQLNRTSLIHTLATNQLLAFGAAGYLHPPPTSVADLPALAPANDSSAPLEFRVRSYFQANCASCHNTGNRSFARWDASFTTPLVDTGILDGGDLLVPGSLQQSRLYHRLQGWPRLMPPIGTSVTNTAAVNLVANWITNLPPAPWSYETIGEVTRFGGSTFSNGIARVGGSGLGLQATNDAFQFMHRPFEHTAAHYVVCLRAQDTLNKRAVAGLMLREGTGVSDRFIMAACRGDGMTTLLQRTVPQTVTSSAWSGDVALPQWLRLLRLEDEISAFRSDDGTNWISLGNTQWENLGPLRVGLAVHAESSTAFNNAVFDELSYLSVTLTSSAPVQVEQPSRVSLHANVDRSGREVARVEFYDGPTEIGQDITAPYTMTVSNLWSGDHEFRARAVDEAGTEVVSQPLRLTVQAAASIVTSPTEDRITKGNWIGDYGGHGYLIVNYRTNLPPFATVSQSGATAITWIPLTKAQRALERQGFQTRIPAAWIGTNSFTISLNVLDGQAHWLRLYFLDWDTSDNRVQRVEFIDPTTGVVQASHLLSNFSAGVYLEITIRGNLQVRITRVAGPGAVLSGIFFDAHSNVGPAVEVVRPTDGDVVHLPSELALEANALDQDGEIERVEFELDGGLAGVAWQAPFSVTVTNLHEGPHTLVARAYDNLGNARDSFPATFHALLPRAKAAFLREDTTTSGNWLGRYGTAGFLLPPITNWWPSGFSYDISQASYYPESASFPTYLELPNQTTRIFPLLYSYSNLVYDVKLADGHAKSLALYFLDAFNYPEVVTILEPATGRILDTQTVSNMVGGSYLVWSVEGHVRIRISNPAGGSQARVGGLFLDPFTNTPPTISLARPSADLDVSTPAKVLLVASAEAAEGIRSVQFHTETGMLGESRQAPYEFLWEFPFAGNHRIFARAVSTAGAIADSLEKEVRVALITRPVVRFVRADAVTGGDWRGVYGMEGYWFPGALNYSNLPPTVSILNTQRWVEVQSDLPRAPAAPNVAARVASWWFGNTPWTLQIGVNDGQAHRVSLYNYAEGATNSVKITARPAGSGTILDLREIVSQQVGTYLTWDIEGEIVFELTPSSGAAALLNAIFLDPIPNPYAAWRRSHFTPSEQINPAISDPGANPDADGYDNWAEYLLRGNPRAVEAAGPLWFERQGPTIYLHLHVARTAEANDVTVESSFDVQSWTEALRLQPSELRNRGETVERRYQLPAEDKNHALFYRLRIEPPR